MNDLNSEDLALIPVMLVKLNVLPVVSPKIYVEVSASVQLESASSLKP